MASCGEPRKGRKEEDRGVDCNPSAIVSSRLALFGHLQLSNGIHRQGLCIYPQNAPEQSSVLHPPVGLVVRSCRRLKETKDTPSQSILSILHRSIARRQPASERKFHLFGSDIPCIHSPHVDLYNSSAPHANVPAHFR